MKKTLLFCIVLFVAMGSFAQENALSITVVQPECKNVPEEARASLENQLDRILTENGVISGMSDRFVISAKVTIVQRDIMPSNPPKVSEKVDVTIMIGDAIDNRVFGKTTISVNGIGVTETKAFVQAFQHISPNNGKVKQLVQTASTQIMDYYRNHCDDILAEADRLAKNNQYDEALTKLITIPEVCGECYSMAQTKAMALYQTKIDEESQSLFKQAQTAWAVHHDYRQAETAMAYLLQINPHSAVVAQADDLFQDIEKTLRTQEKAQEKRRLEKEKEEAARQRKREKREWDLHVQQYKDNVELRKLRIDMFKEVGIAVGKGLPESITKIVRMW